MIATLALKRRTLVERKALALLRGTNIAPQRAGMVRPSRTRMAAAPTPAQAQHFTELRRLAARHGLAILSPASPYLGADELTLLAWLAGAQRVIGPGSAPAPGDPAFAAALLRCADLLDAMGLRLSPLTLYAARTGDPARIAGEAA